MSIRTLNDSQVVTNITPISYIKGHSLNIITVQNNLYKLDNLTEILRSLPDEILSHSIRVANIAEMLAKQVINVPDELNMSIYSNSIWYGCLHHHIGETVDKKIKREQIPKKSVMVIYENIEEITNLILKSI